jgi:DNA topoisomerase VI subunit A
MSDPYGISQGIKSATGSINSIRESTKEITKTIEGFQKDANDVVQQQVQQKLQQNRNAEYAKEVLIFAALEEYNRLAHVIKEESKAKKEFIAKHGEKEWAKVLELKSVVEKERKEQKKYHGHKASEVKTVQFLCFVVAFIVTVILGKAFHLFPLLLG